MKKNVYLLYFIILAIAFLAATDAMASGNNRYYIKSKNIIWKNTFGVRHEFTGGFTSYLADWQLKFAKMFGLDVEPVQTLQILPEQEVKKDGALADPTPWGIEYLYANSEIKSTSGGKDVLIAVLDTGAFKEHPDLKRRVKECKDFTDSRRSLIDGACEDKNGHGTHVSGIIAADGGENGKGIYGVAPESNLLIYRVCDELGNCLADDVAGAMRHAIEQGAKVINLSLGLDKWDPLLSEIILLAEEKNVLVIASAGNDGPYQSSIDYPAMSRKVISVAAFDKEFVIPDWSSRGANSKTKLNNRDASDLDFAAPGVNIQSTWIGGSYALLSGSSMAAPHISGLAAKLWNTDNKDFAKEFRNYLIKITVDISDEGEDDAAGYGFPVLPVEF